MAQVPVGQLGRICDSATLSYTSGEQVQALETIVGQHRGFRAGEQTEKGTFEETAVSGLIDRRLHDLAETMSRYVGAESGSNRILTKH